VLTPGTRLGPYEVTAQIGAGGMGEVYKARDTRLERAVALKVLPEALAADRQFRERFDREARAISQLDHPHICALYDVGEQDGTAYLVMQYLEGETLAARLAKGALPLDQALRTVIEVGSALDKAHRAGIVHRDLKPGNIMLTKGGAKLLDFGLAKSERPLVTGSSLSLLPTTPPNLTQQGTILGTFQYMAPEQLEGQEADARSDIFSFGAVIHEMFTGKKAFEGKSQASLISAIMASEPPLISTLQPLTPPALDRLVKTCLAKDPDARWQSAGDLLRELKRASEAPAEAGAAGPVGASGAARRSTRELVAWSVAAVAILTALAAGVVAYRRPTPEDTAVYRTTILPPDEATFSDTTPTADRFSLSPDGRRLAFAGRGEDRRGLTGTFGAFSASETGILAYQARGGDLRSQLTWLDRAGKQLATVGEPADQISVEVSPNATRVAVSVLDPATRARDIWIHDLTRDNLRTRFTFDASDDLYAIWSPDDTRLIFSSGRKGTLDMYQKSSTGVGSESAILADSVNNKYPSSWSADGRFALYQIGNANSQTGNDLWVLPLFGDRKTTPILQVPFNQTDGRFSPDGRWIAYQSNESGQFEVYVMPFDSGAPAGAPGGANNVGGKWQVSSTGGSLPRWRGDGRELFFLSADNRMMAATVNGLGTAFEVGTVGALFEVRPRLLTYLGYGAGSIYGVSPDGQRFLVNAAIAGQTTVPITLVVNWTAALQK
jgi:Tol biopolymer transport system component